ncbi:MAG: NUDIX domain-containing protein [Candidatus Aenigmarchaeota archaeon]|nr:NUDIX domain-containing protein [Candidatus Aenigmarchaeota archaeon]
MDYTEVVCGIVWHNGRILFMERFNPPYEGVNCFPGGKIEPDQTLENALNDEILDETHLKINRAIYLGYVKEIIQEPEAIYKNLLHFYAVNPIDFDYAAKTREGTNKAILLTDLKNPKCCLGDTVAPLALLIINRIPIDAWTIDDLTDALTDSTVFGNEYNFVKSNGKYIQTESVL